MLATEPTPTRSGYTFDGWYTAETGGNEVTTSTVFHENTTVYARWVEGDIPTYTIKFDANGGTVSPTNGTTTAHGTLSSLPTPTRSGYTFAGWFSALSNGEEVTEHTVFDTDFTIYAHWAAITFTITFDANGGTVSPTSAATGANGRLASEPRPERSGFTFDGWYTARTGGTEVTTSTVFTADATVYARWVSGTVPTYTITFNANSGTVTPTSGITTAHGTISSLPTPTRTGYDFSGWFTTATGGTAVTTSTVFSANATIYAQWKTKTFTVTFSSQGGSAVAEQSVAPGGKATAPANPTRAGYAFGGWYQDVGYTRLWHFDTDLVTEDITLFAKWAFTITFNVGEGGKVNPTSALTDANGKLASLPEPTRDGYTFDGWADKPTGGSPVTTNTVFHANATIYAVWAFGNTAEIYTITFDAKGGTITDKDGEEATPTVTEHTTASGVLTWLPHDGHITRPGYRFEGWFTVDAETGGDEIKVGVTKFVKDATIYARWTAVPYRVTFDLRGGHKYGSGGNEGIHPQDIIHGNKIVKPEDPVREITTEAFGGWCGVPDCDEAVLWDFDNDVVTKDITLHAWWRSGWMTVRILDWDGKLLGTVNIAGGSPLPKNDLPEPKREGYSFIGWLKPIGGLITNWDMPFGGLHITAAYEWANPYTITFNPTGGSVSPTSGKTGEKGTLLLSSLPVPTRMVHTFDGWFTGETGGTKVDINHVYTGSIIIYAHWTALPQREYETFEDGRDGRFYKYIEIGTQTWMAENVNYFRDDWAAGLGRWCYGSSEDNCRDYGRVYTWNDAANLETCPAGYHLPTTEEWRVLFESTGVEERVGGSGDKLKSLSSWNTGEATDEFGFAWLAGGYRNSSGTYTGIGENSRFWSASASNTANTGQFVSLFANGLLSVGSSTSASDRLYVRCVKD
jgi:uncharacterized protein (TIGR02145 family)/uncharacterized repeat protein (TIGR02543 family)